jgi:AcrR family transcriptional regulator
MKNKEIQEQRMRGYFIEATKEIIKGEGLQAVNVRVVADKAGYSYTTMYSYFKDINELVSLCIQDFLQECSDFTAEKIKQNSNQKPVIRVIVHAYADFFIQYPGIFSLFFLEPNIGGKRSAEIGQIVTNSLLQLVSQYIDIEWIANSTAKLTVLQTSIIGLLLFYLNRYTPSDYRVFKNELDTSIAFVLGDVS